MFNKSRDSTSSIDSNSTRTNIFLGLIIYYLSPLKNFKRIKSICGRFADNIRNNV